MISLPRWISLHMGSSDRGKKILLYVGLPLKTEWKLQLVLSAAAHKLVGASRFQHVTPILSKSRWEGAYLTWKGSFLSPPPPPMHGPDPNLIRPNLQPDVFFWGGGGVQNETCFLQLVCANLCCQPPSPSATNSRIRLWGSWGILLHYIGLDRKNPSGDLK